MFETQEVKQSCLGLSTECFTYRVITNYVLAMCLGEESALCNSLTTLKLARLVSDMTVTW